MIMVVIAALAIGLFTTSLLLSGLIAAGRSAIVTARNAFAVMRDPALSDDEREVRVQRASVTLLGSFFGIALRCAFSLGVGFLPIWLFALIGFASIDQALLFLARWDVIVVSTVVISLGMFLWHRRSRNSR